jgi:hypothetical protein
MPAARKLPYSTRYLNPAFERASSVSLKPAYVPVKPSGEKA